MSGRRGGIPGCSSSVAPPPVRPPRRCSTRASGRSSSTAARCCGCSARRARACRTVAVEVVVQRVERGEATADACLLLAPTRLAAARLRDAVTARLGGTTTTPLARTHQSLGFGILREAAALVGDPAPRLLSGPEQDVILGELLAGHAVGRVAGAALARVGAPRAAHPHLPRRAARPADAGRRARPRPRRPAPPSGAATTGPSGWPPPHVLREYDEVTALSAPGRVRPGLDPRRRRRPPRGRPRGARPAARRAAARRRRRRPGAHAGRRCGCCRWSSAGGGGRPRAARRPRRRHPDLPRRRPAPVRHRLARRAHPAARHVAPVRRRACSPPRRGSAAHVGVRGRCGPPPGRTRRAARRRGRGAPAAHGRAGGRLRRGPAARRAPARRRARGRGWRSSCAVAPRTATLRRVLRGAGVPVDTATADLPVRDEAAVRPFLTLLRCALDVVAGAEQLDPADGRRRAHLAGRWGGCRAAAPAAPLAAAPRARRRRGPAERRAARRGGARAVPARPGRARGGAGPAGAPGARRRRRRPARGRGRRGGALADVERERARRAVARRRARWWSGRRPRRPRPRRRAGAVRRRRPLRRPAARRLDPPTSSTTCSARTSPATRLVARAPSGESVALVTPAASAGLEWDLVVVAGRAGGGLARPAAARLAAGLHRPRRRRHRSRRRPARGPRPGAPRRDPAVPRRGDPGAASGSSSPRCAARTSSPRRSSTSSTRWPHARPFTDVARPLTLPGLVAELRAVAGRPEPRRACGCRARRSRGWRAHEVPRRRPGAVVGPARRQRRPAAPRRPTYRCAVSPSTIDHFGRCGLQWVLRASGGDGPSMGAQDIGTLVHEIAHDLGDTDAAAYAAELERALGPARAAARLALAARPGAGHRDDRAARHLPPRGAAEGWRRAAAEVRMRVALGRAVVSGTVDRVEVRPRRHGARRRPQDRQLEADARRRCGATASSAPTSWPSRAGPSPSTASAARAGPRCCSSDGRRRRRHDPAGAAPLAADDEPALGPRPRRRSRPRPWPAREFTATPGSQCGTCQVKDSCPAQPEGRRL